jgi:hypothetical protein
MSFTPCRVSTAGPRLWRPRRWRHQCKLHRLTWAWAPWSKLGVVERSELLQNGRTLRELLRRWEASCWDGEKRAAAGATARSELLRPREASCCDHDDEKQAIAAPRRLRAAAERWEKRACVLTAWTSPCLSSKQLDESLGRELDTSGASAGVDKDWASVWGPSAEWIVPGATTSKYCTTSFFLKSLQTRGRLFCFVTEGSNILRISCTEVCKILELIYYFV